MPLDNRRGIVKSLFGDAFAGSLEKPSVRQRKRRKELIAELDWWSKYYVTKEEVLQVRVSDDCATLRRKILSGFFRNQPEMPTDTSVLCRLRNQKSHNVSVNFQKNICSCMRLNSVMFLCNLV